MYQPHGLIVTMFVRSIIIYGYDKHIYNQKASIRLQESF
nr:MAG TPA: hypothetical protein [Caudoviricetes sp.]